MIKICETCGIEFDAKRDTARFCGAKCRKLAFLKQDIIPAENAKTEVSVPESAKKSVSVPEVSKKSVSVLPGRDDIYSPDYDLSEAGFIRRNKNWMDFSERFKAGIRKTVAEYKEMLAEELRKNQLMREMLPAL